jgi:signal transduction histidine kinase/PAS domain-containing protein
MTELDDHSIRIIADSYPGDFAVYRVEQGKLAPLFASAGLPELSGMSVQEYQNLTREDAAAVIMEADRLEVARRIAALLKSGEDEDFAYRIVHKQLGHIWIHAQGRLIGTSHGAPVILVSFSRSSSEAAGQSKLLNLTSTIMYVVQKDSYEILYANECALDLWGHGDFAGAKCYQYVNGCSAPCPWCSIPRMKDGACHDDAAYAPSQDKWFAIDCRQIDWYGREAVAVFAKDITEQQKQHQSVQADRNQLDEILGSIPGGVALFSEQNGRVHLDYTNNGFYELHHGSREYWQTVSDNPVDWLIPEDQPIFLEEFHRVVKKEKQNGSATYRVIGEDGQLHWVNNPFRHAYDRGNRAYYYASFMDMDDQITAEQGRDQARSMYEAAVEASNLVVWEYDIQAHRIIMAENEFTKYDYNKFGLPKVIENVPESLVPYMDDKSVKPFLELYRRIDSGEQFATCEVWYKLKPGQEPRCEKLSYYAVASRDGKPQKAYGIGQNITSHKREEESYRQAIRQIAQSSANTLGSFSVNLTTNWCGEGKSIYDFVLKQAESGTADGYFQNFFRIIADEEHRRQAEQLFNRESLIQRFLKGESRVALEYPVRYRNGEIHWQQGVMDMMRNPNTGDIEAVTHALDIDRRKRSEQIADSVIIRRLDFAAIIYPCTGAIDFYTVKPEITRVHSGTRCPYDEIRQYLGNSFVPAEERKAFDTATDLKEVLKDLETHEISHCYYRRIENGQDSYRHLQYSWLDPEHSAVMVIQADITDSRNQEKQNMEQLRRAVTEAERANRAKTDFLSRMSHDMRTPLNGIIGMTYLAREQDNNPKTEECLDNIDLSSKFLLGLINDVLDMAKAESGTLELRPEPYSTKEFEQYINAVIRPICTEKNQELVTEISMPEGCVVLADKLKVNRIVFNLLSNAVKYSPEGSRITYRDISKIQADGRVQDCIEVIDHGTGMSEEFQKSLFEPFTQENRDDNSRIRGTGLGLAITKKMVDAMGGTIEVQSRLGKGTAIRVVLTFEQAHAVTQKEPAAAAGIRQAEAQPLAGKHVLLCEDHPLNQEIAKALLEELGMIVETADDGMAGLKLFENSNAGFFDAVLMDIRMPVMNGYEAAHAIRNLNRADSRTVPIIAMTADAYAEDVQRCLDAGMNAHLAKPIDPAVMKATLVKFLADPQKKG